MGILTRVEEIISIPLEAFHNRKGFHPVDLNRMAQRSMEQGSRKGIRKTYAPNRFRVHLSREDHQELLPFLDAIQRDIQGELRRVVSERGYLLAGELGVEVLRDETVIEGRPVVTATMEGSDEPRTRIAGPEDQGAQPAPSWRDARTVIVLPEPESDAEEALEEGVRLLREGRPADARNRLGLAGEELGDVPQYHAAMAVALDLLGLKEEALDHYRWALSLGAGDGATSCPLLPAGGGFALSAGPVPSAGGFLAVGKRGVRLGVKNGRMVLENPEKDPEVRVNGRVRVESILAPGDRMRIQGLDMTFQGEIAQ